MFKTPVIVIVGMVLGVICGSHRVTPAQSKPANGSAESSKLTADYPKDQPGVFIQGPDWVPITAAMPFKTHTKHGVASFFSEGAVPAVIVADYQGLHAAAEIGVGQPIICICHLIEIPGNPVLVKLHPKKNFRELDGGKLPIFGSKLAEATKNDLIPVDVSQPENTVWLVRPKDALPAGDYALMLGTQNMSIFPFTVISAGNNPSRSSPQH